MRAAVAQIKIKEGMFSCRYEGEVNQDGERHGKGVDSWADGKRYVGEQRNNLYHGHGTMTYPDGRVKSGKWEKDSFLIGSWAESS